jgi:hypothetical protein
MSTILNKLKELVNYYNVNRQVGHTFKMINGVLSDTKYTTPYNNEVYNSNVKSIILTHNTGMARNIKEIVDELSTDKQNIAYLSFNSGNYDQVLKGNHSPLLIDNYLLHQLFHEAAKEIEYLKHDNELLTNHSKEVNIRVAKLDTENKSLSTDVNIYKQDNITLNHFNKKLTDDIAISLSIQDKLDERIEKLENEKKELVDTISKMKCVLLTLQEEIGNYKVQEELDTYSQTVKDTRVKVKNELLTYRENESNKDTSQTINRELLTSVRELNEKIDSERRVVDLVGEYKTSQKSFLSPLDMLIENKDVKSIEVKIEYKD